MDFPPQTLNTTPLVRSLGFTVVYTYCYRTLSSTLQLYLLFASVKLLWKIYIQKSGTSFRKTTCPLFPRPRSRSLEPKPAAPPQKDRIEKGGQSVTKYVFYRQI